MSRDDACKINRMPAKDFSEYKWVLTSNKAAQNYFGEHIIVTHDPMFPMHILYKYNDGSGWNSYYLCHSSTLDFYMIDRKSITPGGYPCLTVSVHVPRMPEMIEIIKQLALSREVSPD